MGLLFSNQAQNSVLDLPLTWTDSDKEVLDRSAPLTSMSSANYLWRLSSSTALNSPRSDTSIVTHGTLVTESICTDSPCPNS